SEAAVGQWFKSVREHGCESLQAKPRLGAPPKLSPAALPLLPAYVSHGAEAYASMQQIIEANGCD
ncbi:MAG: hypothetical protein LC737_05160, partial [Chloroflexi bacterium]|nr:hypothetical protein [Chloroflexota bacterium]